MISVEDITIGTQTSRISSSIFFILCFIPIFTTVLFGGVDNTTWVIVSILWVSMVLLWVVEAWRAGGVLL
ncbi:MAG: hypothetical protein ABR530_10115, partial [Pyrinomonadaceae bacterium]